jgi:hypothetical protein
MTDKKKKEYVVDSDATFGGKRIQKKGGPEIKISNKQADLSKKKLMTGRIGKQFGGRTNLLEELGRVEGEPSNRNRRAEISRVHGELNRGYKHGERVKKAKGGRIGKQFGGGLPIQPTVGANLQPTVGANLQPPVGANPMGVVDPARRFGMKHGSKSKGGRTGLKHGGSAGAAKRGHGAEIK